MSLKRSVRRPLFFNLAFMFLCIGFTARIPSLAKERCGSMKIIKEKFGKTASGQNVDLITLTNGRDMTVKIATYGGIVTELWVPDRHGQAGDVVLGFDNLDRYLAGHPYFGALIGRYGNRIAKGTFTLDGATYTLAGNDHGNHLHGGTIGYDKVVWAASEVKSADGVGVELRYLSPDKEEGYPGNLNVVVTYRLTRSNELKIDYQATTDKATPVNLTHHSYFNLAGAGKGDILGHEAWFAADRYTVVDKQLIPTGEVRSVEGTPFDFRKVKAIGRDIAQVEGGYDHNWVLERKQPGLMLAARFVEPVSGRVMEMWTTEPAMQFYTGNFLDGMIRGKGGLVYPLHGAFCLEAQHYPDSPNRPDFPSTILMPGQTYRQQTVYCFFVRQQ